MCGRYALGIRAAFVRYQLQEQGLPIEDAPDDNDVRETYNFPPGSYGLVYRADIPDHGVQDTEASLQDEATESTPKEYKYHLKAMKWGLIPFWTKRSPDYSSMMRTINCRDDSLIDNRGMWTSMKQRKRCIVICQGFYEWLKKGPGGKERIPHFVKRNDGQLMCFAGLWDCVKYEDTEEKLYTYAIITTDSNKQLNFLHDRMPVIFDAGSDAMKTWLNPQTTKWSHELQSLLVPYKGELECYPVSKDVGKVGNNSPEFIVPIDSKENKKNIANFFGNARKISERKADNPETSEITKGGSFGTDAPASTPEQSSTSTKRKHSPDRETVSKTPKLQSPVKKTRSSVKNEPAAKNASPRAAKKSDGTPRITNFFGK